MSTKEELVEEVAIRMWGITVPKSADAVKEAECIIDILNEVIQSRPYLIHEFLPKGYAIVWMDALSNTTKLKIADDMLEVQRQYKT